MIQKIWDWTKHIVEILIIAAGLYGLGWVIYSTVPDHKPEYKPRIQQQQSRQMIKEIYEHLGLGD